VKLTPKTEIYRQNSSVCTIALARGTELANLLCQFSHLSMHRTAAGRYSLHGPLVAAEYRMS